MNILITGACAPISADIARALNIAGHTVVMADSGRWPIGRFSPYACTFVRVPAPTKSFSAYAQCIKEILAKWEVDRIIPTSEEVFWLAQDPVVAQKLFAPDIQVLNRLHDKATFAALAQEMGAGPAYSTVLASRADVARLSDEVLNAGLVAKPVYSRFGVGVQLRPSRQDLLALDFTRPWVVQSYVTGTEVCVYGIAREGKLRLLQAYLPAYRGGAKASIYFEPTEDPRIEAFVAEFVRRHRITGQVSFDVMLTAEGLVALECNPRGTSGVHLAAQAPLEFSHALLGTAEAPLSAFTPEPRCLGLPFLAYHWRKLLTDGAARRAWRRAKDAPRQAGLPLLGGVAATAELVIRARLAGLSLEAASTLDFEWNGE